MSTLLSSIILIGVLNTTPVPHIQIIDRFSDIDVCQAVIAKTVESEKDQPESMKIGKRLQCIIVSYRYDHEGDGPKKPLAQPEMPAKVDVPHTAWPCRNTITHKPVACKEA